MEKLNYQVMPPYEDDPGEVLELRNHSCGSTLAELMPYTAAFFEAEVEKEMRRDPSLSLKVARMVVADRLSKGT